MKKPRPKTRPAKPRKPARVALAGLSNHEPTRTPSRHPDAPQRNVEAVRPPPKVLPELSATKTTDGAILCKSIGFPTIEQEQPT